MGKPPKALVTKKNTIHMYAELWHASSCVLEAGLRDQRGSSWQFLSSALLTAFAFEAYLNHAGPGVYSCWESLERLPPMSKFDLLCETLNVRFPSGDGGRPLNTLAELIEFRNTMAHGRSQVVEAKAQLRDINDKLDGFIGEMPPAHWQRLIRNSDFVKRARADVEVVLFHLHEARPLPKEALFTRGFGESAATVE